MEGYLCRTTPDAPLMRWREVFPERAACRHAQWCDEQRGGASPEPQRVGVEINGEWKWFVVKGRAVVEYTATCATGDAITIHRSRLETTSTNTKTTLGKRVVGVHTDTSAHSDRPPGCQRP